MELPKHPWGEWDIYEYDDYEKVSFREFYDQHKNELPMLIVVAEGIDGDTNYESFDNFQPLRVHAYTSQPRVVARANKDHQEGSRHDLRYYTIPVATPVRFGVIKSPTEYGRPQCLGDILEQNTLPVMVKIASHGSFQIKIDMCRTYVKDIGDLTITKQYKEHFLICNYIDSKEQMYKESCLAALSGEILVCPMKGIRNKSQEEFRAFKERLGKEYEENPKTFKTLEAGNPDWATFNMITEQTGSGGIQSDYEPLVDWTNHFSEPKAERPKLPPRNPAQLEDEIGGVYEELDADWVPPVPPRNRVKEHVDQHPQEKGKHHKGKKEKKKEEAKADKSDKKHGGTKKDKKMKMAEQTIIIKPPSTDRPPAPLPVQKSPISPTERLIYSVPSDNDGGLDGELVGLNKYSGLSSDKPDIDRYTRLGSVEYRGKQSTTSHKTVKTFPSAPASLPSPTEELKPAKSSEQTTMLEASKHDIPKPSEQSAESHVDIVKNMDIREVGESLKKLKLEKYVELFETELVDGEILSQLEVDMLKSDFKFTTVEAIRLATFVKNGHIPQ